jgi:hopene-associated glycosyltransferase HpnB
VGAFVVVAVVALLAWLWLVLARGLFWRTDLRLPAGTPPADWPAVAVVVPARDEAQVLPVSLPTLLAQDYPGPARVVLADDDSTDGTAALAGRLAETGMVPLTVVSPGPPPTGWTGKLWALQAGVGAAGDVEFLLLTDADIAHPTGSLTALVTAATAHRLDLVSQLVRLRVRTGWERLLVPAFGYFFALLYPPRWSNRPTARTAAAAGGCTLVRRAALERAGGLAAIRGAVIDDVALARTLKRSGARTYLGLADDVRSVRPYPTLAALWQMVARSAYTQLHHSPLLLAGTVAGLALVFAVPPAATATGALTGNTALFAVGAAGWTLMAASYQPTLAYHRQPAAAALLQPVTAGLYLAMTLDSARQHHTGRGAAWKGRTYPARH